MKTYKVEGIGPLDLNPDARGLAARLKVLRICSFAIFAPMAFYTWTLSQRHEDAPYAVTIPGLVCLVAAFVFWGLESRAMRRHYYPGDWYELLENSARAQKIDDGREAARQLLKLAGTDMLTCKLKARAHQYLALHMSGGEAKVHQEQSLVLLAEIIEQEPNNVEFRLDRARSYQLIQRYADALPDLDALVNSSGPPCLRAYSMRISCLASLNKQDEAREACDQLEKNLLRFPDKREATRSLSFHRGQLNLPSPRLSPNLQSGPPPSEL